MIGTKRYTSWGRYPKAQPQRVLEVNWRHDLPDLDSVDSSVLPFGYGRSYGDSCLNEDGIIIDVTGLDRFIAFDRENGVLCCEAGVSFKQILDLITPHNWFPPVTPGTKFISVGGAIANDVHGKNHHVNGTFGRHVTRFELLRSDGTRMICSREENADMFRATIGGLGLTGIILWAEFTLQRIPSIYIDAESIQFESLDEFFQLSHDSEHIASSVSWLDLTATGKRMGRGLFTRGDFYDPPLDAENDPKSLPSVAVPFDFPTFAMNPVTVRLFNEVYYHKQPTKISRSIQHYNPFFYPLDALTDWYRVYGDSGFLQYQFVLPYEPTYEPVREILQQVIMSGQASPLMVLKTFGDLESPGMLSFPRKGVTVALDFAYRGEKTLRLLRKLDEIVFANGGALYPAKDARMSGEGFRCSYPNWQEFAQYVDPKFSSSFWRRVNAS